MAGTGVEVDGLVAVVLWSLILVRNSQEDRRAESDAIFSAGVDSDAIFFVTGRGDGRLAWSTAVELGLDISLCKANVGRAVIDDARDRFAMRLASTTNKEEENELLAFSVSFAGSVWRGKETYVVTRKNCPKLDMMKGGMCLYGGRETFFGVYGGGETIKKDGGR